MVSGDKCMFGITKSIPVSIIQFLLASLNGEYRQALPAALREGLYVNHSKYCKRRCEPWKEEATIGLKNAAEQKG
jgi:hypothetical protein